MAGEITGFTIELYRKSTKKEVLAKGPDDRHFWIKSKTICVHIQKHTENKMMMQLRKHLCAWLNVTSPCRLKIYNCHFWNSDLRVSLWAFADYDGVCYRCHVEGVCSYC